MRAALVVLAGASCFMAGLIWTMQILNYPLLAYPLLALIDPNDVPRYEQAHNRRFIWIRTIAWSALGVLGLTAVALSS